MKAKIRTIKEVDVRYLKVDAGVRYWEDTDVNGKEDINFMKTGGEGVPAIPFATKVKDKPTDHICSDHWRWQPTIDVDRGCIVDWPKGTTAHVHYKVCDEGIYHLLDPQKNIIVSVESYVPDCIGEEGDYIVMNIDEDGHIARFHFSQDDVEEIIKGDFGYKED